MNVKAFSLSGQGRPSSLACSMELRTQGDGSHSLIFLSKSDSLSLVNTVARFPWINVFPEFLLYGRISISSLSCPPMFNEF